MLKEKRIEVKLQKLPLDLRKEVLDYIEFLLLKYRKKEEIVKSFKFDWAEGLSRLKDKFTSVELQHKVLEWR